MLLKHVTIIVTDQWSSMHILLVNALQATILQMAISNLDSISSSLWPPPEVHFGTGHYNSD